jgi:molybdate transport system substrate-binding protein
MTEKERTMPTIKVLSAGAVKSMVEALGPEFERATGNTLDIVFGTAFAQRERVIGGATADVVILSQSIIAELEKLGLTVAGSARNLGRTVTGVIVPEGAALPDISTVQAFREALLKAKSVAYTDPKAGGSGGIMFAGLLQKLGIVDAVNAKAVLCKGGLDVSTKIAEKRAEIGTTFISEALPVKGLKVVGPLPGELHNANTYTAAIHQAASARAGAAAFIAALTDPATRMRWTAAGLEPAF